METLLRTISAFGSADRLRRTRTVKARTGLSRPCPAGQTDNGQLFSKIWTAESHGKRFSGTSEQKRGKDRTRKVLSADVYLRTVHVHIFDFRPQNIFS